MNRSKPTDYSVFNRIGKEILFCLAVCAFAFAFASTAFSKSVDARHQLGNLSSLEGWNGVEAAAGEGPEGWEVMPTTVESDLPQGARERWTLAAIIKRKQLNDKEV